MIDMKIIGRLIGWAWAVLFLSVIASIVYESSGRELPDGIFQYRNQLLGWLEAFLSSWAFFVFFIVGYFAVNHHLGTESGWRRLADFYPESDSSSIPKLELGSGQLGKISYPVQVGANRHGLALRVFFPLRFGNPNLSIPWSAIESVAISSSASPLETASFMDRIASKLSMSRYAHIKLTQFPDQVLIIPWKETMISYIPSTLDLSTDDG